NYLMFAMDEVSVNGFMCDPYWAFSIPAGMKAHSSFYFSTEDLELNEISTVTDIEFFLSVYNYDDWEDYYVEETFTVYPLGEEAAQTYERTPKDSDIILFDNDSCTMIITGFTYDEIWGYSAIAYLENKTDAELYYSIDNAKVNGIDCDPFWMEALGPGKKCNSKINWSAYKLEDSGITTIETLDLPIIVNDYSDWENSEVINETFTVTP
ncbi:MAG: hypothetical protein IJW37_00925, partial [Lachnospiraceae bacterium]|nr:hypothetical protein [Lachnospiraceae bacterium]